MLSMSPLPLEGPAAASFSQMMSELNVWGQTGAMIARLQLQANHSRVQAAGLTHQAGRLEASIQTLKDELKKLESVEKAFVRFEKTVGDKNAEHTGLLHKIGALKRHPLIIQGLYAMDNADHVISMKSTKSLSFRGPGSHQTPTPASSSAISPFSITPSADHSHQPVELSDDSDLDFDDQGSNCDDGSMEDVKKDLHQEAIDDVLNSNRE
jgi:hypothetical protein